MTTPKHTSPADTDLGDAASVIDDAVRAESDWLLAREHDPNAPPPSPEIARDYVEIEDLLGNLPLPPSDDRWHDDVLRAARARVQPSRPWWRTAVFRWTTGVGATLAAAVVLLMVVRPPPELEVVTHHVDPTRGDDNEVVVGDHLVVTARPDGPADLRVYRSDGTLVARCPDGPGCRTRKPGELAIEATLDAPVQYHVILVVGMAGALPDGSMDAYLDAAKAAGARVVPPRLIDVH